METEPIRAPKSRVGLVGAFKELGNFNFGPDGTNLNCGILFNKFDLSCFGVILKW